MQQFFLLGIAGYRFIAPLLHIAAPFPYRCRFTPTCSAYGDAAVRQYGLRRGVVVWARRLIRCHPWGGSGWDPLPSANPLRIFE